MRIKICGFKCHIEAEFVFVDGQMTLIKGQSGQGKSSILQAIFWALYGNMRSIYNNNKVTKNLSVTLELPQMTIFRKKNPELLTVTYQGNLYEDTVAQSVIDSNYGPRELWKACSYIEQQSRCILLTGSGSERLELLNALSFSGESPKEYITKINEQLKLVSQQFSNFEAVFNNEIQTYTKQLTDREVEYTCEPEELEELKSNITQLEQEDLQEAVGLYERQIGSLHYLEKSLQEKQRELKTKQSNLNLNSVKQVELPIDSMLLKDEVVIPEHLYISAKHPEFSENESSIKVLRSEIKKYDLLSDQKQQVETEIQNGDANLLVLEEELVACVNNSEANSDNINDLINIPISSEDVWKTQQQEKERQKNIDLLSKWCRRFTMEYQYSSADLMDLLNKLTEKQKFYMQLEKHVDNYNKLLVLNESIQNMTCQGDIEQLTKLSKEKTILIGELKRGLELLPCPKCSASLKYRNGQLSLGDRDPVNPNEIKNIELEQQKIEKTISELRKLASLRERADFLTNSIGNYQNEIEKYISDQIDIQKLTEQISLLSKIKWIDLPKINSELSLKIHNFQRAYAAQETLRESLEKIKIPTDIESKKCQLKELEDQYQKYVLDLKEYQRTEKIRCDELKKWETRKRETELENKAIIKKQEALKIEAEKQQRLKTILLADIQRIKEEIQTKNEEIEMLKSQIDFSIKERFEEAKKKLAEKKRILDECIYGNTMMDRNKELETKREHLLALHSDVETLTRLKLKAIEVECKQLEDTVNNINLVLETTLPIFFTEPISLKLLLYKKIKSKKDQTKPGLNLEICYKGCVYDSINNLSGGEGDRISLALLLALNSVSNSPILLLDECAASLDSDLKENCITAIKSIPNKTVICVDHDIFIEGYYENVISI